MAYSLQGLNNYVANEIRKKYWLHRIYPKEVSSAHECGDIHLHNLGLLSVYCVGWDLQDLLKNGFKGVAGKAESGPAKHFRSALGQIVNFFYTLQGEAEPDANAVKLFIKSVCENYQIPYFTISPSFSICPNHGYLGGEIESCPTCKEPTEIYSRVVGYMRPVKQWNEEKRAEFAKRSHYKVEERP